MINSQSLRQAQAFARQDGALLGLLWCVAFASSLYMPQSSIGGLLTLATPIFMIWRLIVFRNYALEGKISYRRAFYYCVSAFFYAALLFGLLLFIYFVTLGNTQLVALFHATLQAIAPIYQQHGIDTKVLNDAQTLVATMSPLNLAFLFATYGLITGWFASIFIAIFGLFKRWTHLLKIWI